MKLSVFLVLNEKRAEILDTFGRSRDVDFAYGEGTSVQKSCSITWQNEFYIFGGDKSWLYQRRVSKLTETVQRYHC